MNDGNTEEDREYCCISHEFFRVASVNPDKIAVIHASTLPQVSKELRESSTPSNCGGGIVEFLEKLVKSISPPMYSGDSCYTYSDMLKAVQSLSSRVRSILLGWDDPHLVRPKAQGGNDVYSKEGKIVQTPESFVMPNAKTVSAPETEYRPKIVGIYMPPSVEYIVAVLSVLRCGEAFLPLDPFWPDRKIQSVVSSSKADLIIKSLSSFGKRNSDQLDELHWAVRLSSCPILNFSMEENLPECTEDLAWPCENDKKRSFCYLMYTSGSTGKPKGVCGTEQGILNRFFWMQGMYPLEEQDLLLFKSSISFVDHLQEYLSAILTACVLVIPPFSEMKDNAYSLIDYLQAYFVNRLIAVPSLMRTILPGLQNQAGVRVQSSLKLLVLSGESFPFTLWEMISTVLPNTSILNLYGSTEVSGDCTYFDCKRMPLILKSEMVSSVPIGMPISNCDVLLLGENDASNEGELYVGGSCISRGYYAVPNVMPDDFVELPQNYACGDSIGSYSKQLYFRTGDLAKKLPSGDFIFLGRKDRIIKVNGNRIALEEIENLLREHPDINDATVICQNTQGELVLLKAFIILKGVERPGEFLIPSIRSWMLNNLPSVVVPNHFIFTESFPLTASGKVNYELLAGSTLLSKHVGDKISCIGCSDILQLIKKVFCDALMVEVLCNNDDFFEMGGNSLTAAHVAHSLGIDMRLLYYYPTPFKLFMALLQKRGSCSLHKDLDTCSKFNIDTQSLISSHSSENADSVLEPVGVSDGDGTSLLPLKCMKRDLTMDFITSGGDVSIPWSSSSSMFLSCSVSRCNKVLFKEKPGMIGRHQTTWSLKVPQSGRGHLKDLWNIHMESCVDASPMVVFRSSEIYLFIGSHSYKFLCINVRSGRSNLKDVLNVLRQLFATFLRLLLDVTEGKYTFLIFPMEKFVGVFKHLER